MVYVLGVVENNLADRNYDHSHLHSILPAHAVVAVRVVVVDGVLRSNHLYFRQPHSVLGVVENLGYVIVMVYFVDGMGGCR